MTPTVSDILDRLIQADEPLTKPKLIAGVDKTIADSLLEEMISDGFIVVKTKKYTPTDQGRQRWERSLTAEQRSAHEAKQRERENENLLAFLREVGDKNGKSFSNPELKNSSEAIRAHAEKSGLVRKIGKSAYTLLAAGEVALLRGKSDALGRDWHDASKRLLAELANSDLGSALQQFEQEQQKALEHLGELLRRLEGLGSVGELRRNYQNQLDEMATAGRRAVEASEALARKHEEIEKRIEQESQRITAEQQRLSAQLTEAAHRPTPSVPPTPTPAPTPTPTPTPTPQVVGLTDTALWEATLKAYRQLEIDYAIIGGIVKIPELTDSLRGVYAQLTPEQYHQKLLEWQRQGRLTLQVCNDPHFEPRRAEGIRSPRGLLLYVLIRS